MTHTPGPWRIGDAGTTVFGPKTDRPSPLTIATLTKNDTKANGRLIAAAPELLEALKAALALLDNIRDSAFEAGVMSDLPVATAGQHKSIRDAIAKAEGKA